jgi:tetratricopeptide (TPR) repeat protein
VAHAGRISEEMSLQSDLARWTAAALPHLQTAPAAQHAAVLYLHAAQQKHLGARTVPPERQNAIALFREAGDVFGLSRTLRQTAIAMGSPGDIPAEMVAMLEEAVALARPFAPNKDLATALAHTGALHFLNAEHDMALTFNEEALAMRRKLRDRTGVLASFINLAELFFLEGDTDLALRYALEADAEALACNALSTRALVLANIAGYRLSIGDFFGPRSVGAEPGAGPGGLRHHLPGASGARRGFGGRSGGRGQARRPYRRLLSPHRPDQGSPGAGRVRAPDGPAARALSPRRAEAPAIGGYFLVE